MITKILIANRGEIACRVIRTARSLGIKTVAVASTPDEHARHTVFANEAVHIGGDTAATSYLDQGKIIKAAQDTGADAIHPGYGFLSENPDFVDAVEAAGLIFIGPTSDAIRAMGLKDKAKQLMAEAGVPVVPGYDGADQNDKTLKDAAKNIGYPVMIKARAGGGGKGMRRVDDADNFLEALQSTRREAAASFGDDHVLIEKCITAPRHIEVQVFADTHGNTVHLFERDCTLQRRHQKVIEEAPAPGMTEETRTAMTKAAIKAAEAIHYRGAGTVEFIVDGANGLRPDEFWFMEMNTRLQVEHPVTEEITGYDLVEWQINVAAGMPLPAKQDEIRISGHAVEARIYAEDAAAGFLPAPGLITHALFADDMRVDSGINSCDTISPFYDPMIAKIISAAPDRHEAFDILAKGLAASHVTGTVTNTSFLCALARHDDVLAMTIDTTWIDRNQDGLIAAMQPSKAEIAQIALAYYASEDGFSNGDAWRMWGAGSSQLSFYYQNQLIKARLIRNGHNHVTVEVMDSVFIFTHIIHEMECLQYRYEGSVGYLHYYSNQDQMSLDINHRSFRINRIDPLATDLDAGSGNTVIAPMTGILTVLEAAEGDVITKGDILARMEAMKMEHPLTAPCNGVIAAIHYKTADTVSDGSIIISIDPEKSSTDD